MGSRSPQLTHLTYRTYQIYLSALLAHKKIVNLKVIQKNTNTTPFLHIRINNVTMRFISFQRQYPFYTLTTCSLFEIIFPHSLSANRHNHDIFHSIQKFLHSNDIVKAILIISKCEKHISVDLQNSVGVIAAMQMPVQKSYAKDLWKEKNFTMIS